VQDGLVFDAVPFGDKVAFAAEPLKGTNNDNPADEGADDTAVGRRSYQVSESPDRCGVLLPSGTHFEGLPKSVLDRACDRRRRLVGDCKA
jgi:hypothetical protein